MIIKFNTNIEPKMYDYINSSYLDYFITYCIDYRFRTSVGLRDWIKEQLNEPSKEMFDAAKNATKTLGPKASLDDKAIACLKYVISNVVYTPDDKTWNTQEKWQTAQETLTSGRGDCEDGAILMYVLCRLNGIPTNRLLLFAGNVEGGGHCWLGYRPDEYPLDWVFLDWCYWPNENYPDTRPKFYIQDQKIYGEDSRYYTIWFGFNQDKSYSGLRNKYAR